MKQPQIYRVEVLSQQTQNYTSTQVTGGGGYVTTVNGVTTGHVDDVRSTTSFHQDQAFWVRDLLTGREMHLEFTDIGFAARPGHLLTLLYDPVSERWERLVNETTRSINHGHGRFNEARARSVTREGSGAWLLGLSLLVPLLNWLTGLVALVLTFKMPTSYWGIGIAGSGRRLLLALLAGLLAFAASAAALFVEFELKSRLLLVPVLAVGLFAALAYGRLYQRSWERAGDIALQRSAQLDEALERFRSQHAELRAAEEPAAGGGTQRPARAAAGETETAATAASATAPAAQGGRQPRSGVLGPVLTLLIGLALMVAVVPPLAGLPVVWTGRSAQTLLLLAAGGAVVYAGLVYLVRRGLGPGWGTLVNGLGGAALLAALALAVLPRLALPEAGSDPERQVLDATAAVAERPDVQGFSAAFLRNACLALATATSAGDIEQALRNCPLHSADQRPAPAARTLAAAPTAASQRQQTGAAPSPRAASFAGRWVGTYDCAQGTTGFDLQLQARAAAYEGVFSFFPVPGTSTPAGAYRVSGAVRDGRLTLAGVQWIDQPNGFSMVDLSVALAQPGSRRLSGQVLGAGCGGLRGERR